MYLLGHMTTVFYNMAENVVHCVVDEVLRNGDRKVR